MFAQILKRPGIFTAPVCTVRLLGLCLAVLLAGCATSGTVKQVNKLETVSDNPRILIVTPDVKYYLMTAGGVPQPQAEWTEAARANFFSSLLDYANERALIVISPDTNDELTELEISYQKLYSAVGSSILSHHFGVLKLPTKKQNFDWSLGPGVNEIGKKYSADYALFSYYRDYQATGGRVAMSFFAALMGIGVATGGEVGFASLVDLRTGEIVWFNRVGTTEGELRDKETARLTVDHLFKDLPTN